MGRLRKSQGLMERSRDPELLYIRFTRKEQTLILAEVLKGKSDFLGFY